LTASYVYVRAAAAQKVTKIEVNDAGDGTVPVWSSGLGSGTQCQPVGGEHSTIYKNYELRRTLAKLLGFAGVLVARAPDYVELALREKVTEPEEQVHLTLSFPSAINRVEGHVRLYRAEITETDEIAAYVAYGDALAIMYAGMNADKLDVSFEAPGIRGIYKVVFESVENKRLGEDELFVQDPSPAAHL
jgi:hypothetical protein